MLDILELKKKINEKYISFLISRKFMKNMLKFLNM